MNRRSALASATAVMASVLAGCSTDPRSSTAISSFESDYAVSEGAVVTVTNRNGSVTITDSADDRLRVSGEKRATSQDGLDSMEVEVITDERVAVQVKFADSSEFTNRSVDLTVALPNGAAIGRALTTNGSVRASDVTGDLQATTTNGSVELRDIDGFVRAKTTNGNVTVRNTTGLLGARSTNGNVDVEVAAMRSDVDCVTSNGDVTARVGPDVAAAFRLSTNSGSAVVEELEHSTSVDRRDYVVGSLRGGESPTLYLGTNNGSVLLRPI